MTDLALLRGRQTSAAPLAVGAAALVVLGVGVYAWRRRQKDEAPGAGEPATLAPGDLSGPLGSQLQKLIDAGFDTVMAAAEAKAGMPVGLLSAIASRETGGKMTNLVGDYGHGRGLFQIDDRSHQAFLRAQGVTVFCRGKEHCTTSDNSGTVVGPEQVPPVPPAADYAAELFMANVRDGRKRGVAEPDLVKFALSAYNAGPGNAWSGYHNHGDSDHWTSGKDYGRDVLKRYSQMFPSLGEPALREAQKPAEQIAGVGEPALAPALRTLREQIDTIWPDRSTASDGDVGDSDEPDHMAGNAIDFTNDPTNGPDLRELAELLLGDPRTHYVIFDSRIANRDVLAGAWRPYPEREDGETLDEYEERAKGYNSHTRHLHLSVRRSGRADGSLWPKGAKDNGRLAVAMREEKQQPAASRERLPELLRRGLLGLWRDGLVDNFRWVPLKIGEYEIQVTADAAAAFGVRIPASFEDVLAMTGSVRDILPPTKAIVDARWVNAARRIVLPPLPGGARRADGIDPMGVEQVQEWDRRLGPVSGGPLGDGAWKEWILEEGMSEGKAVNYGLRKPDGSVWQRPGHAHDADWKDYSQLATFVKRKAKKNGVEVDLLEELAKGSPLGGPLPEWIVNRLEGRA